MDPQQGLNAIDYGVIVIVLLSGLLALIRGFVREMFSLVTWAGACIVAAKFYPHALPWVHHYVKADKPAQWAAVGVTFLGALIVLAILGHIITGLVVRGSAITAIDRSLGFLYGLLRGAAVVSLIYLGAVMIFWPDIDKPLAESATTTAAAVAPKPDTNADKAAQEKTDDAPPELLMQARTRPLMAYGAKELASLIPKKMIDRTFQTYTDQKNNAQKAIDQRALDMLSTPEPKAQPVTPTNNDDQHLDVNKIMNPEGTP